MADSVHVRRGSEPAPPLPVTLRGTASPIGPPAHAARVAKMTAVDLSARADRVKGQDRWLVPNLARLPRDQIPSESCGSGR
jgi:hypothetical protein